MHLGAAYCAGCVAVSSIADEKQAMEMTEYGKHDAGFPPFPHSLEIPSGFPHSHGLDDWIYVFSNPLNSNHSHRKGLVTDVSGPQRNACPGTLMGMGFNGRRENYWTILVSAFGGAALT
jgi:hypothetical protein